MGRIRRTPLAERERPPFETTRDVAPAGLNLRARLGELLVGAELLTPDDLIKALEHQPASGRRIGEVVVDLGLVPARAVASTLGEQLGVPVVDLRHEAPQRDTVALLSAAVARDLVAIPLRRDGEVVIVAVADPGNGDVRAALEQELRAPVRLVLAPRSDIEHAINNSYRALDAVGRLVETFRVTEASRAGLVAEVEAAPEDAPVVRIVNLLITQALRDRASDIHIEPHGDHVSVRFRVDGALQDAVTVPGTMGPAIVSRLKVLAGMNIVERRRPQDGQFGTEVDERPIDIRVSTVPTISGEKAVLRLLARRRSLLRLDALGMPSATQAQYSRLARTPFGMVVCAGPTGSGKTTTLYATLAEINDAQRNVTTLEDPVEYVFPSVNQIQVNEQAGVTFADGLRSVLRQDPDVILVGEIRDVETARLAVQSALTGHLVMTSIHATDAPAALQRFVDMGIERFLVASSVTAVVSQRLVRRICMHCRAPYQPAPEELAFLEACGPVEESSFMHGTGCNFCAGTGYQDRIGVYEMLRVTDEIRHLVLDGAPHGELRAAAVAQGMRTLIDEGVRLVHDGVTTAAEIMRNIYTD